MNLFEFCVKLTHRRKEKGWTKTQCHLDNDLKTKTKGLTIRKKGSQFFLFLKNMFFRMTIKQMLPSA